MASKNIEKGVLRSNMPLVRVVYKTLGGNNNYSFRSFSAAQNSQTRVVEGEGGRRRTKRRGRKEKEGAESGGCGNPVERKRVVIPSIQSAPIPPFPLSFSFSSFSFHLPPPPTLVARATKILLRTELDLYHDILYLRTNIFPMEIGIAFTKTPFTPLLASPG